MDPQKFTSLLGISFQFQPNPVGIRKPNNEGTTWDEDMRRVEIQKPRNAIYEGNLQAVRKLGKHPEVLLH